LGLRRADALWLRDRMLPALALVAAGSLLVWLLESPFFFVQRVKVLGANGQIAQELVRASGIGNQSLFVINPTLFVEKMYAVPDLASATLQLQLPSTLTVHVRLYQPVAVWESGGKGYLVTEHGYVIKPGDDPKLLHIATAKPTAYKHGDIIDPALVRSAYLLRDLLNAQRIGVQQLTFLDNRSLEVRSPSGWVAIFGVTGDLQRQVAVLATFLATNPKFTLIDLRYGNVPYYRT
ncbi:MAG: hypothetical protein M1118_01455, partial [Chloroflexi bacterium]|nr:hypothetical protein [Chloroflexota bacterium]